MKGTDIYNIAAKQLGVKEYPPNSNRVKYNTWYYGKEVSGGEYPWCMVFVQWCYSQAGAHLPLLTASCGALLRWYMEHDPGCIVPAKEAQAGDIVIFDFPGGAPTDHTGIVEGIGKSTITTIDGNTGTTNEANGGAVMRRTRSLSVVRAVIRPRLPETSTESGEEEEMDIDKLIEQMTPEQAHRIYQKGQAFAGVQPMPVNWSASEQLADAMQHGITDGSRPMAAPTRLEVALMADRALVKALNGGR